jgi:hypothetical protein
VYYNIVEGHPEYYDNKSNQPILDKYNQLKQLLQDKNSVVYHAPKNDSDYVKFNPNFIENVRNEKGEIYSAKVYSKALLNTLINIPTFDNYLSYYLTAIMYINELFQSKSFKIVFTNDTNKTTDELLPFNILQKISETGKSNKAYLDAIIRFIKVFKSSPNIVMKAFQDQGNSFNISTKVYSDMTLQEKIIGFLNIISALETKDLNAVIDKLKKIGVTQSSQLSVFDLYAKNKLAKLQSAGDDKERPNPDLSLWDDLYYLFPAGFDDQLKNIDDELVSGYYLFDIENRQRKNFIDYVRTFIKPLTPTYAFRKKCMMFVDTDPERNRIITNLIEIYNVVGKELENINRMGSCDNPEGIEKLYNALKIRIDKQFRLVDNYKEKIANQEFSYFATSKLKWLLNEMNNYYEQIKIGCKSDGRSVYANSIRNNKTLLQNQFKYSIDLTDEKYNFKVKGINMLVEQMDTNTLTLSQLQQIDDIYKEELALKIKEAKALRNKNKK